MKILVVDDDPMAAEMICAILEDGGHQVRYLENGVEAMEQLQADPAELIISDMNMPLVSGLELFQELRAQGDNTPFVLLTGDDPSQYQAQAPQMNACLMKDDNLFERLLETVEQFEG
jgi:CheY-like chemotaxis protein